MGARLLKIKRARARFGFADGSIKVLETFCSQNLTTKKPTNA
jgi:hypothetical protein